MSRRVCLAIGVSDVTPRSGEEPRFAFLDGAPAAAQAIGEWALRSRFGADNVSIITDEPLPDGEPNPVTTERVQAAVDALFPENITQTDHVMLSFCGHGLTGDFGTTFWLFSDALKKQYRVNVDAFISELLTFGIKRFALISDACRDAPKDLDLMRLDPHRAIIGRRGPNDSPMFDRLAACQDGHKAYMVGDPTTAARGKCILSGVVLDVLWGNEPDAFKGNVINTHTFGKVTRERAAHRASQYGLKLRPQVAVDPEPIVLVDGAARPEPPFELPPWPPAARATTMGAAEDAIPVAPPPTASLERLSSSSSFREEVLGPNFGTSHPDLDPETGFTGLPEDASSLVDHLVALRQLQHTGNIQIESDISSTISALEGKAARYARAGAADTLLASLRKVGVGHEAGVNLIVSEGNVRNVWSERPIAERHILEGAAHLRIELPPAHVGAQIVIEFEDGVFIPVCVYPELCAVVLRNPSHMAAIAYTAPDNELITQSALAIDELTLGVLDSTKLESVAARIRYGKHANPILGAIAAYLYRQLSDFDNLRRMAYYYVDHRQPIPFDIALLGQMDVYAEGESYFAKVPAVPSSKRDGDERSPLPNHATTETPAVTGRLSGRCPWLTLGWDYPPTERFGDRIYQRYRAGLFRPSSFTSVAREFGERLVQAWNLRRQ